MIFMQVLSAVENIDGSFSSLVRLLQILGGIFGLYLIFWIISTVINLRRTILLKKIITQLDENNQKLDRLVKSKKKKKN
ncbi:hypothetical protein J4205_00395 [Candidatus Pacearchaeota archaeon]|nr:hypothetical protein [Candidatus Pacearchaeota archaeon]